MKRCWQRAAGVSVNYAERREYSHLLRPVPRLSLVRRRRLFGVRCFGSWRAGDAVCVNADRRASDAGRCRPPRRGARRAAVPRDPR